MAIPYEIAVRLSAVNNFAPALAALSQSLLGINSAVKDIERNWGRVATALSGAASLMTAGAIAGGLKTLAGHGKDLLNQQDQMERLGVSHLETLKLTADYYRDIAKAIPTSNVAEFLQTVRELRAVTGSAEAAEALAPKALMTDALLANTMGDKGRGQFSEFYKFMRSAEMKGIATNEEQRNKFTDLAFSYVTAFGGKLTPQDFQSMARRGGTAFINADLDKALGPLAVLAADLGGQTAGQTAMTLQQLQTGANTLSKQQAAVLAQAGILDMSKTTKTGFGGGRLQLEPGAMLGASEHMGDLPGWIRDVVYPKLMEAAHGDKATFDQLLAKIAPNRNAAKLVEMFGSPGFLEQQAKDLGLAKQVKGIPEAYGGFINNNAVGVEKAYEEQKNSMLAAIGAPLMQAAIPVMKGVTDMFTKIGEFANSHPENVKLLGEALAGLAAGLAVFGTGALIAAMAAFAPAGTAVAAVAGLATTVGTLAALNWGAAASVLAGISSGIATAISTLSSLNWGVVANGLASIAKVLSNIIGGRGVEGNPQNSPPIYSDKDPQLLRPESYKPGPAAPAPTPIHVHFHVDGQEVEQAVTQIQARNAEFPSRAPYSDSYASWTPPDSNIAWG